MSRVMRDKKGRELRGPRGWMGSIPGGVEGLGPVGTGAHCPGVLL